MLRDENGRGGIFETELVQRADFEILVAASTIRVAHSSGDSPP